METQTPEAIEAQAALHAKERTEKLAKDLFTPTGLKTYTEVIDGATYSTTTLTATEGLVILPKLVALLGEDGLSLLIATSEEEQESLWENKEVQAALIMRLAENAAKDEGLLIVRRLLQNTTCDKIQVGDRLTTAKVRDNFDAHFAGNYMHLVRVAIWVGRMSFGKP